jgi:4'-phosphopantetheinyl transferase
MSFDNSLLFNRTPFLRSDEVHIWSAYIHANEKNLPYFVSILSEDERKKAYSFRFSKDQKNFFISRGILKCLLGRYLGQAPQDIKIMYGLWGKPCVHIKQPLLFNLSHSRDYVLYAITRNYEVGIDLEYIDPNFDIEEMIFNLLSPQELIYWKSVHPKEKINIFFKLWVNKEAFLKASGKGWIDEKQSTLFEVLKIFKKENNNDELNKKMVTPYYFKLIPDYASAFFIEGPFLRPLYYVWNSTR